MFHCVLYQPEIPPNTGNVIRLCANTGTLLHLVHPLGFVLDDSRLRRAGLDYHEWARVREYPDWETLLAHLEQSRLFACSTKGRRNYAQVDYRPGDVFVFGPETRGLPGQILRTFPDDRLLRIPMLPHSRSLNLSNSVAVMIYEAWRQQAFVGGA